MLELKNIVKDYVVSKDNVVHALKDISLTFPKTGLIAILGESGCGKTTLLNILGGLDKYTSGDLIIDGKSTKDFNDRDWDDYRNKKVGMIFQSYNLVPHMSNLANVELALSLAGTSQKTRSQIAFKALERVGLKDQAKKFPNQLSGGQTQRVAIARALVNNPSIILADEPTGALDSETSIQVMDLLKEISKDKLIIVVTHNRELAKQYATSIIKMADGKILENKENTEETTTIDSPKESFNLNDPSFSTEKKNKSSMSLWTAIYISLKNMLTKKGRFILTSIAGSFGIIGIALILAISNGFSLYIDNIEEETLASYPLTVDTIYFDTNHSSNTQELEKYPDSNDVYIKQSNTLYYTNNITEEYLDYVDKMDSSYYSVLQKNYALQTNIVFKNEDNGTYSYVSTSQKSLISTLTATTSSSTSSVWFELPGSKDYILDKYDLIGGKYPSSSNELILVVSNDNSLSNTTISNLGFNSSVSKLSFNEIQNKAFKIVDNDDFYKQTGTLDVTGKFMKDDVSASKFYSSISNYLTSLSSKDLTGDDLTNLLTTWKETISQYFEGETETRTINAYAKPGTKNGYKLESLYSNSSKELKIVGILRPKSSNVINVLNNGIYYTSDLIKENLETASNSSIAKDVANHLIIDNLQGNSDYLFPQTYSVYDDTPTSQIDYSSFSISTSTLTKILNHYDEIYEKLEPEEKLKLTKAINDNDYVTIITIVAPYLDEIDSTILSDLQTQVSSLLSQITTNIKSYTNYRQTLGTDKSISSLTIYPKSFETKSKILDYLNKYNENKPSSECVYCTDVAGTAFSVVENLVNVITIVLICFSSVSLIVSSVMIGIITYSSVVERTKEIGIYRAIGARKKDISRLFKTEAAFIGLFAGLVGVIFTYIACPIINAILSNVIEGINISNIAQLNLLHALVLIGISIILTYFSALVPARFAANKDPVKALRTD